MYDTSSDYSNDPAAWGPELWEAIERAGLKDRFKAALHEVLAKDYADAPQHVSVWEWRVIKSTPEQKARALAKAIMEVGE